MANISLICLMKIASPLLQTGGCVLCMTTMPASMTVSLQPGAEMVLIGTGGSVKWPEARRCCLFPGLVSAHVFNALLRGHFCAGK